MRTVRSAFGKETVGARGGGGGGLMQNRGPMSNVDQFSSCKINTTSISWNMKMNQTRGIHSYPFVCVVFCVMRCHLCDAVQNRDYSWFSGTCGDYHPCHLRLILAAGQRSGGISHISPSLRCRRKIPKKRFLVSTRFLWISGNDVLPLNEGLTTHRTRRQVNRLMGTYIVQLKTTLFFYKARMKLKLSLHAAPR